MLEYASDELKRDPDVVRAAIGSRVASIRYADKTLRKDDAFLNSLVDKENNKRWRDALEHIKYMNNLYFKRYGD